MVEASWFVQRIQVASRRKQKEVLDLCSDASEVTAFGLSEGRDHFVIVESSNLFWQSAVELLIAELDPSAHLVWTSGVPSSTWDIRPGVSGRRQRTAHLVSLVLGSALGPAVNRAADARPDMAPLNARR